MNASFIFTDKADLKIGAGASGAQPAACPEKTGKKFEDAVSEIVAAKTGPVSTIFSASVSSVPRGDDDIEEEKASGGKDILKTALSAITGTVSYGDAALPGAALNFTPLIASAQDKKTSGVSSGILPLNASNGASKTVSEPETGPDASLPPPQNTVSAGPDNDLGETKKSDGDEGHKSESKNDGTAELQAALRDSQGPQFPDLIMNVFEGGIGKLQASAETGRSSGALKESVKDISLQAGTYGAEISPAMGDPADISKKGPAEAPEDPKTVRTDVQAGGGGPQPSRTGAQAQSGGQGQSDNSQSGENSAQFSGKPANQPAPSSGQPMEHIAQTSITNQPGQQTNLSGQPAFQGQIISQQDAQDTSRTPQSQSAGQPGLQGGPGKTFDPPFSVTRQDSKTLEVRIDPEGLGKMDIRLVMDKGHVNAHINASESIGKEVIEGNLRDIIRKLAGDGISVGSFSVSLRNGKREGREGAEKGGETPQMENSGSTHEISALNAPEAHGGAGGKILSLFA